MLANTLLSSSHNSCARIFGSHLALVPLLDFCTLPLQAPLLLEVFLNLALALLLFPPLLLLNLVCQHLCLRSLSVSLTIK
jgi:hypothetical protein